MTNLPNNLDPINAGEAVDRIAEIAPRYLKDKAARQYYGGISRFLWTKLRERPDFPKPARLGRILVWDRVELDQWFDSQKGNRSDWYPTWLHGERDADDNAS